MRSKLILIVEDEDSLRKVLLEKLKQEDFEVLEAKDGKEGLDVALQKRPDLILLDIVMPVMDGLTMVKRLREAEREEGKLSEGQVPVVFLTNLNDDKMLASGQQEGIYDYLIKSSWTLEGIVKKIKDKLNM